MMRIIFCTIYDWFGFRFVVNFLPHSIRIFINSVHLCTFVKGFLHTKQMINIWFVFSRLNLRATKSFADTFEIFISWCYYHNINAQKTCILRRGSVFNEYMLARVLVPKNDVNTPPKISLRRTHHTYTLLSAHEKKNNSQESLVAKQAKNVHDRMYYKQIYVIFSLTTFVNMALNIKWRFIVYIFWFDQDFTGNGTHTLSNINVQKIICPNWLNMVIS